MPEPKRPLKVFLCHAHADRDAVRALYTRLTNDGVDAWLDKAKLLPGQDWELEIRKAVREADVVVVCLSKQFNQAGFRQKEVRLALDTAMEQPEGEIFIVPARLEECDNLESLRRWHWVDLFEEDGYEMLMRALRARANKVGAILQIKKNWLPTVNTQHVVMKKPSSPVEKLVEKKQEKPKPKKEIRKPRSFKETVIGFTWFLALVWASIFGLRPLIGKLEPTPVATSIATSYPVTTNTSKIPLVAATKTTRPVSTPTKTLIPTFTPTFIPLSAVTNVEFTLTTFSGIRTGVNYVNCPKVIANITANGRGTITYHWTRSDGAIAPTKKLFFNEAGTMTVSEEWGLGSIWAGGNDRWLGIYIDSPNSQDFGHISVIVCTAP